MNANPLVTRLQQFCPLDAGDLQDLNALSLDRRHIAHGTNIVHGGSAANHIHLILSGWAARYKVLTDGTRQITALLLPGDLCGVRCAMLSQMDQGIMALTPMHVAYIKPQALYRLESTSAGIRHAMNWCSLVEDATSRAWIINLGCRQALPRTANLFSELSERTMMSVPDSLADSFLPLTQLELADTLGLTPVHVNRVLRELQQRGMVALRRGGVMMTDLSALRQLGSFDGAYLRPKTIAIGEQTAA
ncbi:Crp/Fnr family transcriptional regulator [Sphingomonas mollis]|uniref:Crp/Fnr family transcriptional regulator n=1 Tax=Sphingomonas mollis TaxID=2795726 RepID=A0ABS0XVJ6_9SPHN|nr:Crp/Fnr family transcriptional regulator [Sphingomonas sp. BT553]MBJ6123768.1 Crp/Fnr family transcriptional regulator [Sphingomonas sp. BT553]